MRHPTREECERLLKEYGTPEHVQGHCRAVAETACNIGAALNEKGLALDLDLILAAGLLHDIARVEDRHWEVGARLMEKLGYLQERDIIKTHMRYDFSPSAPFDETDLVCLADRLVLEDKYAGLDERIDYIVDKAARNGHPEAKAIILKKKEETKKFVDKLEKFLGRSIDELMKGQA